MFNSDRSNRKATDGTASPMARTLLRSAALVALVATLAMPVQVADAGDASQLSLVACRINGDLVEPVIASGKTTAWIFVTNLDQPMSRTKVRGCMAVRTSSGTTYQPDNYCTVMNNVANLQFGNGVAEFDNNAYLQCTIPNPREPSPTFWVHARVNLPATPDGDGFTLLSSPSLTYTVTTNAACLLRLNSRYNNMLFSHDTVNQCGSFVELNSFLFQGKPKPQGSHRIGPVDTYGPVDLTGSFALPANYTFSIGAVSDSYTLDYLVIDPPGSCCNPN